jgi:hypothetical protein
MARRLLSTEILRLRAQNDTMFARRFLWTLIPRVRPWICSGFHGDPSFLCWARFGDAVLRCDDLQRALETIAPPGMRVIQTSSIISRAAAATCPAEMP